MSVTTPEGATWGVYDQNSVDNKRSMNKKKGELRQSMYEYKKFIGEENLPNINSMMVMNDDVNRYNKDAAVSTFGAQDVNFTESEVDISYWMSNCCDCSAIFLFGLESSL